MRVLCLVSGSALTVYTLYSLTRGRFHLGRVLPVLLGAPLLILAYLPEKSLAAGILAWYSCLYAAFYAALFFIMSLAVIRGKWENNPEFILVAGAALTGSALSETLRRRLEDAYALSQAYPRALILLTGGQCRGEDAPESEVMKRYLMEKGIPEKRILTEPLSQSTYENMLFSKPILMSGRIIPPRILAVTSSYHALRLLWAGRAVSLPLDVYPSQVPPAEFLAEAMREGVLLVKTALFGFQSMTWAYGKL